MGAWFGESEGWAPNNWREGAAGTAKGCGEAARDPATEADPMGEGEFYGNTRRGVGGGRTLPTRGSGSGAKKRGPWGGTKCQRGRWSVGVPYSLGGGVDRGSQWG